MARFALERTLLFLAALAAGACTPVAASGLRPLALLSIGVGAAAVALVLLRLRRRGLAAVQAEIDRKVFETLLGRKQEVDADFRVAIRDFLARQAELAIEDVKAVDAVEAELKHCRELLQQAHDFIRGAPPSPEDPVLRLLWARLVADLAAAAPRKAGAL